MKVCRSTNSFVFSTFLLKMLKMLIKTRKKCRTGCLWSVQTCEGLFGHRFRENLPFLAKLSTWKKLVYVKREKESESSGAPLLLSGGTLVLVWDPSSSSCLQDMKLFIEEFFMACSPFKRCCFCNVQQTYNKLTQSALWELVCSSCCIRDTLYSHYLSVGKIKENRWKQSSSHVSGACRDLLCANIYTTVH